MATFSPQLSFTVMLGFHFGLMRVVELYNWIPLNVVGEVEG